MHRTAGFLWFEGNAPADIEQVRVPPSPSPKANPSPSPSPKANPNPNPNQIGGECNVGNLEAWMRIANPSPSPSPNLTLT